VEEHVGLVVFEHLRHELRIHVCYIDLLEVLVQCHDGFVQLFLGIVQ
jgi:hypothetical protein